ncbi:uncharacterized protein LOC126974350 [Leptidea sinapis]|uniref:uncharacterized protein LOC126974350 n=1 Tax=Leptidea sinapis TaxID=189913 RepID=UPI0021C3AD59|nr:uncharacterized protein LOC126974350 [Leptidea sinapis]
MTSKAYRWCSVPLCTNTSIKTPEKLFIFVPFDKKLRKKWLELARRDLEGILPTTQLYFCEDHFDLPNYMANYMEYVMGSVSQIRMKPGCVPSKFECQPDRRKRTSDSNERKYSAKKQRREVVAEAEQELQNKTTTTCSVATEQLELEDPTPGTSAMQESTTKDAPKMVNKSIQVYITNKFRSKAVQTEIKSVDQMTSPSKPFCRSAFTSPFKITSTKPSISTIQKCSKKIGFQADSDSDISHTPSVAHSESPSVTSLKIKWSSDCSELIEDDKKQEASRILAYTLQKIKKNPRSYIGVPNSCYYLIDLIEKKLNIPTHHIIMCFKSSEPGSLLVRIQKS